MVDFLIGHHGHNVQNHATVEPGGVIEHVVIHFRNMVDPIVMVNMLKMKFVLLVFVQVNNLVYDLLNYGLIWCIHLFHINCHIYPSNSFT